MYNYRLTKRGKFALSVFIFIVFCLINVEIFQIIVNAENEKKVLSDKNNITGPVKTESGNNGEKENPYNLDDIVRQNAKKSAAKLNTDSSSNNSSSTLTIPVESAFDDNGNKIAFLTFDDGPSRNISPQILEILKKYDVKATFFVLGKYAEINKNIIRDIYKGGHAIGQHGYSHRYDVIYKSGESFKDEVSRTSYILSDILGKDFSTRLFRFPGGSFESSKDQFKTILKDMNYTYVDWNVVIGDAEANAARSSSKDLYDRFISTVKNKNHVIILMHDSSTKQETADILPKVVEYLKAQGYEFAVFK